MANSIFVQPGSGSSGSGGGTLPTAPIGQVLISQGAGVAPIFSPYLRLSNPTAPANGKNWRIYNDGGGNLRFHKENDALALDVPFASVDTVSAGIGSTYGSVSASQGVNGGWTTYNSTTFSGISGATQSVIGTLVNITDSTTNTVGATVAGGGTFNVLARWNGTVYKVVA